MWEVKKADVSSVGYEKRQINSDFSYQLYCCALNQNNNFAIQSIKINLK